MPLSRKNLSQLSSRHLRKKSPYFLVEGVRCCLEAVRRRPEWLQEAYCLAEFRRHEHYAELAAALARQGVPLQELADRDFQDMAVTEHPQGVICALRKPTPAPLTLPHPFCLVLDQVREPGNLGTILRTAWAVGLESVWITAGSADVYAPKVIRAGMGAQFALQLQCVPPLPEALETFRRLGGRRVWCAMPGAGTSLFDDQFDLAGGALVIGNEGDGVSHPELGEAVTIPMPGHAESLNAAQATTLLLFEAVRRGILH